MQKSRLARDERGVQKVLEMISQNQNPFDLNTVPSKLTNIISGKVASDEVEKSLTTFLNTGAQRQAAFTAERLLDAGTKSFWDPESRVKVSTFDSMRKPITNNLMVSSEVLFRRLLAVSKQRDVDLHSVLKYELAAVSPSLFYDDGQMRKTTKAELAKKVN